MVWPHEMKRYTHKLSAEIGNSDDKVFIVATTNMPWELDIAALKR